MSSEDFRRNDSKPPMTAGEKRLARKRLELALAKLGEGAVFVEGKKDRDALAKLGFGNVYTISGNLRASCARASANGVVKAILLTDMDKRGGELANEARDELGRYGIACDAELRKIVAGMLKLRCFEDMKRKYDKKMEEISE